MTLTTVASIVDAARAEIDGSEFVSVASCTDWLLDCYNAASRPQVKAVIIELLPQFSSGNLRATAEFEAAVDQIALAIEVDSAFDELDITAIRTLDDTDLDSTDQPEPIDQ